MLLDLDPPALPLPSPLRTNGSARANGDARVLAVGGGAGLRANSVCLWAAVWLSLVAVAHLKAAS